ncbi:MAG: hypothetical protein Aurels2KO_25770 [Aureliella sp.]
MEAQQASKKTVRVDGAHIEYPQAPDGRGRARVTLRRKAYYFGQHGSPESYVMFGAWLADLKRSDEPSKGSVWRDEALELVGQLPLRKWSVRPWAAVAVLAFALAPSVALTGYVWISSSASEPSVDDRALSALELNHVRLLRQQEDEKLARSEGKNEQIEGVFQQIMSTGTMPDAPPPRLAAKPEIGDLN